MTTRKQLTERIGARQASNLSAPSSADNTDYESGINARSDAVIRNNTGGNKDSIG
jgi:hypothetical protein